MHKEQWTLQNRNIHHLNFEEPLDARNLVASVPNDNPESLARATSIVADHNALAGLNPEAIKGLVEAAAGYIQAVEKYDDLSTKALQWWKTKFQQALKNLKGE